MEKNKIFILTAVHNELFYTKKLLKSIFSQSYNNYQVYLINDGSTDETDGFIHKNYSNIKILNGDGNLWWAGSLNLGIKEILKVAKSGDYIWVINNDCFFGKNYLRKILTFVKTNNSKTIIGSTVVDAVSKKIIDNGVKIDWTKLRFSGNGDDALSSKGTLYPISVFKEVGLFDAKHFPHYFSDYEFAIRAKRNGYTLKVFGGENIYNFSKRTGSEKINFSKKSKLNILTQINMILYTCPKEYKLKAILAILSKFL